MSRDLRYAEIDRMAEAAHREIRTMAQQAKDEIGVKVGWMIRSDGQRRRYERAKNGQGR